jgi:hypothetical protein
MNEAQKQVWAAAQARKPAMRHATHLFLRQSAFFQQSAAFQAIDSICLRGRLNGSMLYLLL